MRKLSRKGLIKKNWQLCREIKFSMDGRKCEICGSEVGLEVDHCFSRNSKELFYHIPNLTVLCRFCHSHKTYRRHSVDLKVYEHVETREGSDEFNRMRKVNERIGGFPDWQYMWYHEQENLRLKEMLAEITELK